MYGFSKPIGSSCYQISGQYESVFKAILFKVICILCVFLFNIDFFLKNDLLTEYLNLQIEGKLGNICELHCIERYNTMCKKMS